MIDSERPRGRRLKWVLGTLGVLLLLCVGGVWGGNRYVAARGDRQRAADMADIDRQATIGSWPEARTVLDKQAAALVRGDEAGWLAAVDPRQPQLVSRYRKLFESLRALDVSGWSYHVTVPPPTAFGRSDLHTNVTVAWCLRAFQCPAYDEKDPGLAVPRFQQALDLRRTGDTSGAYVITGLTDGKGGGIGEVRQPTPWQGDLVFAQGKRVTVGAPPALAGQLPAVVAAADQAAAVDDRFAGLVANPQQRYRVYLAGDREWNTWFGQAPAHAIGYAINIGSVGTDVVLHLNKIPPADLVMVLRHELGHVVTLSGTDRSADAIYDIDQWLIEGIAEYIAFAPQTGTPRMASIRATKLPPSIVQPPFSDKSTAQAVDAFYGNAHLTMNCLAAKYGEKKLLQFALAVLRLKASYGDASMAVLGKPFHDVDTACVVYLKQARK